MEFFQRNAIERGLINCESNDLIIISDVDEIVNPDVLKMIKTNQNNQVQDIVTKMLERETLVCDMDLYYYYFNLKLKRKWRGAILVRYKNMLRPQEHRNLREKSTYIPNAGWHLSYFGNAEFIKEKTMSIVDGREVSLDAIKESLKNGTDIYGRNEDLYKMEFVKVNDIGIKNIEKYIEKYPQYFYKVRK